MRPDVRKNVLPILAGLILIAAIFVAVLTGSSNGRTLSEQQARIDDLSRQVLMAQAAADAVKADVMADAAGGSVERVAADDEVIAAFLNTALTWDSQETYDDARVKTMRLHGLAEDSAFMTSFLPVAPFTQDAQGNYYSYIDAAGLNSQMSGYDAQLLYVDGVDRKYLVLANVRSKSNDGRAVATSTSAITLTVDGEGALVDVVGFAASDAPVRVSG